MRRLVAILTVLGICVLFAQAQAISLTVRPMFGYGIGTGRTVKGQDYVVNASAQTTKHENIYYSAGGGIKLGFGVDVEGEGHLALGIDMGYSIGLKAETDKVDIAAHDMMPRYAEKTELKTSYLPMSMTLKAKSSFENLTVFAGFGPTLLLSAKGIETENATYGTDRVALETETTFKMGLGYHGLAGMEYGLDKHIVLMAQVRADQVSIKADKGNVTKYTVNGKNMLSTLTIREKNTTYVEDDTKDTGGSSAPDIDNTYILPANSFTMSIGIGIRF
jgi:hypothetical protein